MSGCRRAAVWAVFALAAATAPTLAQAQAPAQVQGPSAEPTPYTIDPTHTFVTFEVAHFNTSINRARFDRKEGEIRFDRAGRRGRAEITIDMASVSSGVAAWDAWMKSDAFFDVARFPTARFVGERLVFAGDRVSEVHGSLTLMGKTEPLVLRARLFDCYTSPLFKREVCGGDFDAVVRRSAFGLNYGLPAIAPDEVKLLVQVEAIRQER